MPDTAPPVILILAPGLPATRRNRIKRRLEEMGCSVAHIDGGTCGYLEVTGETQSMLSLRPECWSGVARVVGLAPAAPLAAWGPGRGEESSPTTVDIDGPSGVVTIGPDAFTVMAGPCSVEDPEATIENARAVAAAGARVFRAGAFKPRTSPYAFQGLGHAGLEVLAAVRRDVGLPIVTEVLDVRDLSAVAEVADVLQVGSRNMHHPPLLQELGRVGKPVLLKRGFAATLEEFLLAAEYILSGGNDQVILCERGLRSGAGSRGVVLDLGAIPELRARTHLPIVVDPSHGAGHAARVRPLARAAAAVGADGVLIEVHREPELALSDGQQALTVDEFTSTVRELRAVRAAIDAG